MVYGQRLGGEEVKISIQECNTVLPPITWRRKLLKITIDDEILVIAEGESILQIHAENIKSGETLELNTDIELVSGRP